MGILTDEQMKKLIENGKKIKDEFEGKIPVVAFLRFYNNPPSAWMLASVDPDNQDKAYGLMEIADGKPELGYVSLKELEEINNDTGKIDHEPMFLHADKLDIHEYARIARDIGQISLRITERITKDDLKDLIG